MERRSEIGGVKQSLTEGSNTRSPERDSVAQACRSQDILQAFGKTSWRRQPRNCASQSKGRREGRGPALEGTVREGQISQSLAVPPEAPSHSEQPGRSPVSQLTLPRTSEVEILFPFTRRGSWSPERADHFPEVTQQSCPEPSAPWNHPGSNKVTFRNAVMLSSWTQEGFSSCFTCILASKRPS